MRSRVIVKCREWCGYLYESIMEWFYSIAHKAIPHRVTGHSLTEEYVIYERYANIPFVREFLEQRTCKALMGKYCIKIKCESEEGKESVPNIDSTTTIGTVRLMRKKELIDRATLVIKDGKSDLIFWKFN